MRNAFRFVFTRDFARDGKFGPFGRDNSQIMDTLEKISHGLLGAGLAGVLARFLGG